jgi:hypothetical protein
MLRIAAMGKSMWKVNGEPTAHGTRKGAEHLALIVRQRGKVLSLYERYEPHRKIGDFRSWQAVARALSH